MKTGTFSILLLLFCLLLVPEGRAQITEAEIMLSGNYHYGEGYAVTREEAIRSARVDLIEKLVVVIDSEMRSEIHETEEDFRSEFASRTRSMSRMQLRGLNYLNLERRDKTWKSIAYISKEDYERTLDIERNRLTSLLNQVYRTENTASLQQAASGYAELLIERQFYPVPIYTSAELHGAESDIADFSRNRLRNWMDDLEIRVVRGEVFSDGTMDETNILLELTSQGHPVNNLMIGLDRAGYGMLEVVDGRAQLFVDVLPDAPEVNYRMVLQPRYAGSDPELRALAEQVLPQVRRRITVDFSGEILLDFSVIRLGTGGYQFQPEIQNLAVSDLHWDFGDGRRTNQASPRHVFDHPEQVHSITLRVNRDDRLIARRDLHPDGRLMVAAPPDKASESPEEIVAPTATEKETPVASPDSDAPPDARETEAGAADPVLRFTVPLRHREMVEELKRSRNYNETMARLNHYQRENRLRFGSRQAVDNVEESYVLIVNTERREIEALLSPEIDKVRQNLLSNELIEDLAERYRGRAPVWILMY